MAIKTRERRWLPVIHKVKIEAFDGGLNLRDAPSELAPNESPDCLNVTLDERGGVAKRLGYAKLNTGALASAPKVLFYWQKTGQTIVQVGAEVRKTSDFVTFTLIRTLGSTAEAAFCDFQGLLVSVHPIDGVATYDGAAWTLIGGSPKGTCIAAWQNKVFVGDGGITANAARLSWSNAGTAGTWTGTDFNDLRDKDTAPLVALAPVEGVLLAFKTESSYRVGNSTTGSYNMIDGTVGAAGARAVVVLGHTAYLVSKYGIFRTNGGALSKLSERIELLFNSVQLNMGALSGACIGYYRDRIFCSLPLSGVSVNSIMLELHPVQGWIVPHSIRASCFAQAEGSIARLYAGATVTGFIHDLFKTGADDGAAIACRWQSKAYELAQGGKVRLRHVRVAGRGAFTVTLVKDYVLGSGGDARQFAAPAGPGNWNGGGVWNGTGLVWGPAGYEVYDDFFSLGTAKSFAFRVAQTGTASATAPPIGGGIGVAPEVGYCALYSALIDYLPLGEA